MYTRILVATDGSELSQKAVATAIDLAVACKAELIAFQAVPPYPISYSEVALRSMAQKLNASKASGRPARWPMSAPLRKLPAAKA